MLKRFSIEFVCDACGDLYTMAGDYWNAAAVRDLLRHDKSLCTPCSAVAAYQVYGELSWGFTLEELRAIGPSPKAAQVLCDMHRQGVVPKPLIPLD